jgi:hypothetical protein
MAKLADAADLKSAGLNRPWGFKSPSGHQLFNSLEGVSRVAGEAAKSTNGCFDGCWRSLWSSPPR